MKTLNEDSTGPACAALIAAALGPLTLAISHLAAEYSEAGKAWVYQWGKAWMPGAEGIGPYSGKETLALVVWLGSWVLLHLWLHRRQASLAKSGVLFLVGIGLATTLLWPPVTGQVLRILHGAR